MPERSTTSRWRRFRAFLARRQQDGRLPQPVSDVLSSWLRARSHAMRGAVAAVVRRPPPGEADGAVERADGRRWRVSGDVPCSLHDLAHDFAQELVGRLTREDLGPFLVDADGHRLCFGLRVEERERAGHVITELSKQPGWYLDWRRGSRRGTVPLGSRDLSGKLARAEWWRLYRLYRAGRNYLVGRDQAVELSFWGPGPGHDVQRLGVRGHHKFGPMAEPTTEVVDGRDYPGLSVLPVERALTRFTEPIDVVYTWVDGGDPSWRKELEHWVSESGVENEHASHDARYHSRDELRYSLRSLWLNAGWVRKVFVVTAGQTPHWLVQDERLRVVDHREIFPEEWLPTFNSHAIEARLHRIDGLAEHFIYFNDDMFLGRALAPRSFFEANGLARVTESEALIPAPEPDGGDLAVNTAARNGQQLLLEAFGRTVKNKVEHGPYSLRRSILFEIEERFSEVMEQTARSRFRHPDDLSVASAFAHHYAFCTGRAAPGDLRVAYHNFRWRSLAFFLDRLLAGRDYDSFCLNDASSEHGGLVHKAVARFLKAYFPVPSPWEKSAEGESLVS